MPCVWLVEQTIMKDVLKFDTTPFGEQFATRDLITLTPVQHVDLCHLSGLCLNETDVVIVALYSDYTTTTNVKIATLTHKLLHSSQPH